MAQTITRAAAPLHRYVQRYFVHLLAVITHRPHACDLSRNDGGGFLLGLTQDTSNEIHMSDRQLEILGFGLMNLLKTKGGHKTSSLLRRFCCDNGCIRLNSTRASNQRTLAKPRSNSGKDLVFGKHRTSELQPLPLLLLAKCEHQTAKGTRLVRRTKRGVLWLQCFASGRSRCALALFSYLSRLS